MNRTLRLLSLYTTRSYLEWSGFRSFLLTLVMNQSITPLLGLTVWSAALPGERSVSAYFVALLAVQLMTVSQEYYSVTLRIFEGGLNDDLLRPHPFVLGPLGASVAIRVWHTLIGLPCIGIAMAVSGVRFGLDDVLIAIPALALAATLRFLFEYTLALSALWTQKASWVGEFGSSMLFLLGGVAAPLPLFPERIRSFGEALPFRAMLGFPAEVASGSLTRTQVFHGYAWQVLWIAVFVPVATFMWRSGVRRYTALGG